MKHNMNERDVHTFIFFHQYLLLSFPEVASNCDAPACSASVHQGKHSRKKLDWNGKISFLDL